MENTEKSLHLSSEIRVMQNFLHSKTLFSDLHGKDSKTSLEKKKKKKLPAHKNFPMIGETNNQFYMA
jgi:hypothetical protein